jgi:hypothetical protein
MIMSYYKEGSISGTHASTNSNSEGGLSLASIKLELLKLLVGTCNLSVLSRFKFSCIVQLILYNRRVSVFRCCLFRLSLLRIIKIIKQLSSFIFSLLAVLFYSINIRRS